MAKSRVKPVPPKPDPNKGQYKSPGGIGPDDQPSLQKGRPRGSTDKKKPGVGKNPYNPWDPRYGRFYPPYPPSYDGNADPKGRYRPYIPLGGSPGKPLKFPNPDDPRNQSVWNSVITRRNKNLWGLLNQ